MTEYTGRTRRFLFVIPQWEILVPVYVGRCCTPYNMDRWPRKAVWTEVPPPKSPAMVGDR